MLNIKKYSFIIMSYFVFCCNTKEQSISSSEIEQILKPITDTIYFINTTKNKFGFSYTDKYLATNVIHILPNSNYKVAASTPILLYQTNENQNFYLVYPGDSLYTSMNSLNNSILSKKDDSIRNNELSLSWQMNEATPLNFYKIAKFREELFDKNYKKLDSIYNADYRDKVNFINNYKKKFTISEAFERQVKAFLQSNLFASELWLGTSSKSAIDQSFAKYLFDLKPKINSLASEKNDFNYTWLQYNYVRYTLKNLRRFDSYQDSLYTVCKQQVKEIYRDKVLFKIVKDEIEGNAKSKKWFIKDFIETSHDSAYRNNIVNIINNNEIFESAGNNDVLITETGAHLDFESLIKSLNNKIIYVDFWASWCTPCRKEMEPSSKMRNKYKSKNVEFIYLSLDDNLKSWQQANIEEGLNKTNTRSYILVNAQKTQLYKRFKITSIPRYVLLGKKGEVLHANAPRPSDPELAKLLDKYISQ